MREEVIQGILRHKIIAIVRGVYGEDCLRLARALHEGGIKVLEATFDQSSAENRLRTAETIKLLSRALGDEMFLGAGTVTSADMVEQARAAGAKLIVSPNTDEKVIGAARAAGLVSIPGALTPTEIQHAWACGADIVKVFPACTMGAGYFKNICAPLSQVRMLAAGGVTGQNIGDYFSAGVVAAGVSGCLFQKAWIAAGDWRRVTKAAGALCGAVAEWEKKR